MNGCIKAIQYQLIPKLYLKNMRQGILILENNGCSVSNSDQSRSNLQANIILVFLIYYMSLPFIEAPLRYYLVEYDIPWAIYIRDVLVTILCLWFIIKNCLLKDYDKIVFYFICFMILHSIIGLIYLPDYFMVLFGWKIFLPILIGLGSYYVFVENLTKIRILFVCLFLISITGLLLNYFVDFPWEGLTYTLDMYTVEASRMEETIFSMKRLTGFGRFAFDAAIQIILVSLFLVVHVKNNIWKIIIWALAGLAILLTTVKGIIISYLLISVLLIIQTADKKIIDYYHIYRKLSLSLLLLILFLPILSYFATNVGDIKLSGESDMLFTSFIIRLYDTWPEVIDIIQDYGNFVLGRGLGGLGQSQIFFENNLYNPADNIFLYLYAQFGLMGLYYLIYLYCKSRSLNPIKELYLCLLVLFIFQYGMIASIFESPLLCLSVGFVLAHLNNDKLRMEYQKQLSIMEINEKD